MKIVLGIIQLLSSGASLGVSQDVFHDFNEGKGRGQNFNSFRQKNISLQYLLYFTWPWRVKSISFYTLFVNLSTRSNDDPAKLETILKFLNLK